MRVDIGPYTEEGQSVQVEIHDYDVWSMDQTLAHIIIPMLKKLKDQTHSYPSDLTEESWDAMLDEMIWAFEQKLDDGWEDQYVIQHGEIDWDAAHKGKVDPDTQLTPLVWKKEHIVDWDKRNAHQARMTAGFKLFGERYEHLWD